MQDADLGASLIARLLASLALAGALTAPALAGGADVLDARAEPVAGGYRVSATIRHADEGWDHYADAFEVLAPDGRLLATRTLHHPHVDEQPFTRSVNVVVPNGVRSLTVRARDSVHGFGGAEVKIALPGR